MSYIGVRGRAVLRVSVLVLSLLLSVPTASRGVAAQEALDSVEALIASGRGEDARAALMGWWDGATVERPERGALQRALWLRGLLTVDPAQAVLDYQRLVVEYPGGAWSDQALLRLAQAAEARGDHVRARSYLEALLRDYPGSAHRLEAGRMIEGRPTVGVRPPDGGGRLDTELAGPAEDAPEEDAPAAAASGTAARWTVQVGAFAGAARARGLRDELREAGVDARVVTLPGTPLLRVRAGRFEDPERAEALRRGLVARGLDATVADDADREEAAP